MRRLASAVVAVRGGGWGEATQCSNSLTVEGEDNREAVSLTACNYDIHLYRYGLPCSFLRLTSRHCCDKVWLYVIQRNVERSSGKSPNNR
jgi:hypothetical protein